MAKKNKDYTLDRQTELEKIFSGDTKRLEKVSDKG